MLDRQIKQNLLGDLKKGGYLAKANTKQNKLETETSQETGKNQDNGSGEVK